MAEVDNPTTEILSDPDELLWRNVHPSWIDDGKVSSQAFRPTRKDAGRLSTARSSKVSAAQHFEEHTGRGLQSGGVWAVTVGDASNVSLTCIYDEHSLELPTPVPTGHTSIDFIGLTDREVRKAGGVLRDRAEDRGRQHP